MSEVNPWTGLLKDLVREGIKSVVDDLRATTADNPNGLDGIVQPEKPTVVHVTQTTPAPPPAGADDVTIEVGNIKAARVFAASLPDESWFMGQVKFERDDVQRATAYSADAINQSQVSAHESMFALGLIIAEYSMRVSVQQDGANLAVARKNCIALLTWLDAGVEKYFQGTSPPEPTKTILG